MSSYESGYNPVGGVPKRIFKPDWEPERGKEDRGLLPRHDDDPIGNARVGIQQEPVEFKERFKRVVIPEK